MTSTAQSQKEKGNSAFKAGDYPVAIGHYSAAIVSDRTDPTLPLNRAAAYLKLGKNEDAERDCTTVLSLPGGKKNVKAYFRRAQARVALGKKDSASDDLEEALRIEPSNEPVKMELKKLEAAKVTSAITARKQPLVSSAKSASTSSPEVIKPYRRRVPITIVESGAGVTVSEAALSERKTTQLPSSSSTSSSRGLEPSASSSLMKEVSSRSINTPSAALPAGNTQPSTTQTAASQPPARDVFTETREIKGKKVGGGIFRHSRSAVEKDKRPKNGESKNDGALPGTASTTSSAQASNGVILPLNSAPSDEPNEPELIPFKPHPPTTKTDPSTSLFTFNKTWTGLNSTTARWNLIYQIHPSHLPKLFRTSLEPPLFTSILQTFDSVLTKRSEARDSILQYMQEFPKLPRFKMVLLFLSDKETEVLASLVERIGGLAVVGQAWRI